MVNKATKKEMSDYCSKYACKDCYISNRCSMFAALFGQHATKIKPCCHKDSYFLPEPWPDGNAIEVCNCCGQSRSHWEWDKSPWLDVDLVEGRRELENIFHCMVG